MAINLNEFAKGFSNLDNFGLAILAKNATDLENFQDFCRINYLPVSKINCLVTDECNQSIIDRYRETGIDQYHLEYAMIVVLTGVQYDETFPLFYDEKIIVDQQLYSYPLKIFIHKSETNLTDIRSCLLGKLFFDNHDDFASTLKMPSPKQPQFVSINDFTAIACWPLPRRRDLRRFKNDLGITHILTLQNEAEVNQTKICQEIQSAGIISIHWPIRGAEVDVFTSDETVDILNQRLPPILDLILNSNQTEPVKILIHCAAGLHRTGSITYLLLRLCHFTMDQSLLIIHRTRSITAREVAQKRILAVENHLLNGIIQVLPNQIEGKRQGNAE